jgi:hypothetical protein
MNPRETLNQSCLGLLITAICVWEESTHRVYSIRIVSHRYRYLAETINGQREMSSRAWASNDRKGERTSVLNAGTFRM